MANAEAMTRSPVLRNAQLAAEKWRASWLDLSVSMVSSATETKTLPSNVGDVLNGIRSGKWAKVVNRVRDAYVIAFKIAKEEGSPDPAAVAKKSVNARKRQLPAVTFSGTFKKRADNEIEQHSGLLCIDLDNCQEPAELRSRLALDPCVQAAFISPTGSGVKTLVRILSPVTESAARKVEIEGVKMHRFLDARRALTDCRRAVGMAHVQRPESEPPRSDPQFT